jgi:uncharacterized membrane protein
MLSASDSELSRPSPELPTLVTVPATTSTTRHVYLDWMRGIAILIMIQTHVFSCFTRADRHGAAIYRISQFTGGITAAMFLFVAGMMVGLRMESRSDRGFGHWKRMFDVLKRAGYVLAAGVFILFLEWVRRWSNFGYMLQVGILNCIALAIAVSAPIALLPRARRPGAAIALGAAIAAFSPVAHALDWSGVPSMVRNYFVPNPTIFTFFPAAAYVPFGIVAGIVIRRAGEGRIENAMRWLALAGCGLVTVGVFCSDQPYSLYPKVDYWVNSPGLIAIRTGLVLLFLVASFVWVRVGFSTVLVRQLGTTALLVFWAHIELVYGFWSDSVKGRLTVRQSAWATCIIVGLMYVLSILKTRLAGPARAAITRLFAPRAGTSRAEPALDARLS